MVDVGTFDQPIKKQHQPHGTDMDGGGGWEGATEGVSVLLLLRPPVGTSRGVAKSCECAACFCGGPPCSPFGTTRAKWANAHTIVSMETFNNTPHALKLGMMVGSDVS